MFIAKTNKYINIKEEKAINHVKNAEIMFPKNSLDKQLEMAEEEGQDDFAEDIKIRIIGIEFIKSELKVSSLPKGYKWLADKGMMQSFAIHYHPQRKIAVETGVYQSFWRVRHAHDITNLTALLAELGIYI